MEREEEEEEMESEERVGKEVRVYRAQSHGKTQDM